MKKSNQHYVPRSILRNFTSHNNVFCLFKDQDGKIINPSVENLCAEKEFYCFSLDIEDEDTDETLDYDKHIFDKIDQQIALITKKVINQNSVVILDDDDRKTLAKYVVYQYLRSPAMKNLAKSLSKDDKSGEQIYGLNLLDGWFIEKLADVLNSLNLKIIYPTRNCKFIISDSPVLWTLTAEGIYFPISPLHCLCYHKEDSVILDSICINELEFLASVRFNIAQDKDTLNNIWQQTYKQHIDKFCRMGNPSYWKCMLTTHNYLTCIKYFKYNIYEEFFNVLPMLRHLLC